MFRLRLPAHLASVRRRFCVSAVHRGRWSREPVMTHVDACWDRCTRCSSPQGSALLHCGLPQGARRREKKASHKHNTCSLACLVLNSSSPRSFSNGIFRSNRTPAFLPLASSSLTHTRRICSDCNETADQSGSLAGSYILTVYAGVVECSPASLPPASSSLTHARRICGDYNQKADQCRCSRIRARLHLRVLLAHTQFF